MKVGTEVNAEELTAGLFVSPSAGVMINRYSIAVKYGFCTGHTDFMDGSGYVGYKYMTHAISIGLAVNF